MKIRRKNYIFVTYIGDHSPRHVHVYKDNQEIGKWDLENHKVMQGKINKKIIKLIEQLVAENLL